MIGVQFKVLNVFPRTSTWRMGGDKTSNYVKMYLRLAQQQYAFDNSESLKI